MHGRVEGPQDISNAVLFLASDDARYVTRVAFPVDSAPQYVARPGWKVGPGGPTQRLRPVLVTNCRRSEFAPAPPARACDESPLAGFAPAAGRPRQCALKEKGLHGTS